MSSDQTQYQSSDEQQRARSLSLKRLKPPTQVPGYEPRRFLGAGAYGEVWVALDRTTGRQVAIKFYAHRGGLDWSLLSREVEKLAFLSADRYVVQLLDVGWDAEPPYYVMEYVEHGSLEELLSRRGKLPADQAVAIFREVAVGLMHAHGKGVLHCDLKPANVLLDQDARPRLADFGQSRLSYEQTPALGTLFYMAPEQADLNAVPDVRWDVYALGALLHAMLTGAPPYKSPDVAARIEAADNLEERLRLYRETIAAAPPPAAHRLVRGVDRALAQIVDRCLAPDGNRRYPNAQAVVDALDAREQRRRRRPLVVLGAIGPALLLAVMSIFAWRSFDAVIGDSDGALRNRALDSSLFAAKYVAKTVTNELDQRYQAVEDIAVSQRFQGLLTAILDDKELEGLRDLLTNPQVAPTAAEDARRQLLASGAQQALQRRLVDLLYDDGEPAVSSWFVADPTGLQLARAVRPQAEEASTVGYPYGWRTYFHGGSEDHPADWRPGPADHITDTHLSRVFRSQATGRWSVAISTPIVTEDSDGRFLGVIGLTVDVGQLVEFQEHEQNKPFAVLVDMRAGQNRGLILQHPLYNQLIKEQGRLPDRFQSYRVTSTDLPDRRERRQDYDDPLGEDEQGGEFRRHWLAAMASVSIRDGNTGWVVVVQESYDAAIGRTLGELKSRLLRSGLLAVGLIAGLSIAVWAFVIRLLNEPTTLALTRVQPEPSAVPPATEAAAAPAPAEATRDRGP